MVLQAPAHHAPPHVQAFQRGIQAAQQRPGADALVLGAGGGLLSLLAAQAGCGSVTAVERSRMLFRMAKQCLEANAGGEHAEVAARVRLVDRRLQSVGVEGEAAPPDVLMATQQQARLAATGAVPQELLGGVDAGVLLPRRARAPAAGGAAAATAAASWSCDCSWQAPATSSRAGHVMEGSALPLRHPPAATPSFRAPCGPSVPLRCAAGWAGSQGVGGKEEAAPSVQGSPGWC